MPSDFHLGQSLGEMRGEWRSGHQRQLFLSELTLQEVRAMRADADRRHAERAAEKAQIPRLDTLIKQALRWALPLAVLLATGSVEKALQVLAALK